MGQWSKLSAQEKAQIIKFAIKNGVLDINSIRDTYNVYAKDSLANVDYNMAAAKASGFGSNGNGHYPDTFKKPNHPTFSDESIYHSEATLGGRWRGNTYEPSDYVINRQGGWNQFLRGFYGQEQGTGAVPVFDGGVMLPEVTVTPQYKEGGGSYNPLIGKKYYKDGGILEGDFDVEDLTYEEIKELDRLGYSVERL